MDRIHHQGIDARGGTSPTLGFMALAAVMASIALLAAAASQGNWLVDGSGRPIATDFINVYAAGRLALEGQAAAVYDWVAHKQAEIGIVGRDFGGYFGWHYPPTFLFVATPLALLPLLPAMMVWLTVTLAAYVATIHGILRHRTATLLAAGFPAVLWNFVAGQNGLLTAALVGGSLLLLERRPLVSGVLLGLLTYKPQFGVLFPLALAMDGRWRVMGVAAGTALALVAASVFCFGLEAWREFFSGMPAMTDAVFVQGRVGLHKLQTLLGVVRWLGGGMTLAWTLQGLLVSVCVVATAAAWRSRQPLEIKAAALSTAALLATPYLFIYDFVVLAVAIAFICSIASRTGFLRGEGAGLALAALSVLAAPIIAAPTGFVAALIVGLSVVRRARMAADAHHTIIPVPMRAGLSSARS